MHRANPTFSASVGPVPILASVLFGAGACLAQSPSAVRVADVTVTGNQRTPTEFIIRQLQTRAGATFNPDTVQEDTRMLAATRQFISVEASFTTLPDGRVNVSFLVSDYLNKVEDVEYRGATKFKPDDLDAVAGIKPGRPLIPSANKRACEVIVREYIEGGYIFASCVLVEGGKLEDRKVIFAITEGPRVAIDDVEFKGNELATTGALRDCLLSRARSAGGEVFPQPCNAQKVETWLDNLREFYRSHGLQDVQISRWFRYDPENTRLTVVFHIDEAPVTHREVDDFKFGGFFR